MIKNKILNQVFFTITSSKFHRARGGRSMDTPILQPYARTTSSAAPQMWVLLFRVDKELLILQGQVTMQVENLSSCPHNTPISWPSHSERLHPSPPSSPPNTASICSYVPFKISLLPMAPFPQLTGFITKKVYSFSILPSACRR